MGRTLELYKHLRKSRKRERELLGYNTPKEIWNTESTYVDRDTGEIILKRQLENGEYIKLKTTTKYKLAKKKAGRQPDYVLGMAVNLDYAI